MSGGRLASHLVAGGLLRLAEGEGGFGTVVARGDRDAGAILVMVSERGRPSLVLERVLKPTGDYGWSEAVRPPKGDENGEVVDKFLARRRRSDPDLWILELDTASAERLTAQIIALD